MNDISAEEDNEQYEMCQDCGNAAVSWLAENPLWLFVMGYRGGTICPFCFDKRAKKKKLMIHWQADVHPAYKKDYFVAENSYGDLVLMRENLHE